MSADDFDTAEDQRAGIQSVEVAAAILDAMTRAGGPQQLKNIATAAAMPPGKVHRYLVSLVRSGLAVQDARGDYAIGPRAIALGLAGLRTLSPVKLAPEFLRRLRDETGETSVLMLWSENGPVVVDIEESAQPIFMNIRPGSALPVERSAAGRTFAAHLPAATVVNLNGRHASLTEIFGRSFEQLKSQVRSDGYASVRGVLLQGIAAMAAPVFDHRGGIVATLAFLAREQDVEGEHAERKAVALKKIAGEFSARIGFTGD